MRRSTLLAALLAAGLPLAAWSGRAWARTIVVAQNHPQAADTNEGTEASPLKTISKAAELAQPGDTVLVRAGAYRERVAPERGGEEGKPIVYAAAPGEEVFIKGSDVWKPAWQPIDAARGIYQGPFGGIDFGKLNPYRTQADKQPKGFTLGQLFVDGRWYRQVTSKDEVLAYPCSWSVNEAKDGLYVNFGPSARKPQDRLVELTVRGRIFAPVKRGLGYITVRGFVMEHCANNFPTGFYSGGKPQQGALGTRAGHHWVIEDNVIRYAQATGLDCGAEGPADYDGLKQPRPNYVGHHVIRNNVISDNGNCGIAGYRALRTQIVGNIIERNNCLNFGGAENGGMKAHFFIGGLIEGNLFRDNDTYGLWLDNVWAHTRVTRNVFIGNRDAGVFFEMGGGPAWCDNNIIAFTRGIHNGAGIYSHDAGGMTIAHNLIVGNELYGVYIRQVTGRKYAVFPEDIKSWDTPQTTAKPCRPVDIRILNNIIASNARGCLNIPYPGPAAQGNASDHNIYNSGGMMSWLLLTPFVANTNGGVDMKGILAAYNKALDDNNVPPDKRKPAVEYHKGPLLDLEQWRLLTGFDKQSAVPGKFAVDVGHLDLTCDLTADKTFWDLGAKAVAGVDKDFFGNAMPADKPVPGPFQNLKAPAKGTSSHRFILWPVVGGGMKASAAVQEDKDTVGVQVD